MATFMVQVALITKAEGLLIIKKGAQQALLFLYLEEKVSDPLKNIELASLRSPIQAFRILRKPRSSTKISPVKLFTPLKAQMDEPAGTHKDNPKYGERDGGKVERHF
ncbi:hypothetical protein FM042_01615 [Aliidiomarina halalkaliphila]|uniref:Uncharacterized protein n=1 Tax=Aliidiomarina halalkaliphila TaxID=2593535 RepID=A0A552X3H8_9GAMM|nr:hypothetical protein [Aliidiomarina halalkaliphila]TRW49590.1 hypothetical protein FM042_01615 [Aliidiomarina halalkaliphila]